MWQVQKHALFYRQIDVVANTYSSCVITGSLDETLLRDIYGASEKWYD